MVLKTRGERMYRMKQGINFQTQKGEKWKEKTHKQKGGRIKYLSVGGRQLLGGWWDFEALGLNIYQYMAGR